MKKIRVIIVDDSLLIRELFTSILSSDPMIEVVATALDPLDARQKIKDLNPDVMTLDIEMPHMDGLSFLEKVMRLRPMPVVMISSLTQKGAAITLQALEMGAVDYVSKSSSTSFASDVLADELIAKVKTAASAKVMAHGTASVAIKPPSNIRTFKKDGLIAIGSSTGGVEALRGMIGHFPVNSPPIVITQHMPKNFTTVFAERLNQLASIDVHEVTEEMVMKPGHAYIAQGGTHLLVRHSASGYRCLPGNGEAVSGHCPSVDVMFEAVAAAAGSRAVGAILTGMGKDGTNGLLSMKNAGAHTIGQDEKTCVVYGMPRAAHLQGAVTEQLPLAQIPSAILNALAT